jgi:hypothetical protein
VRTLLLQRCIHLSLLQKDQLILFQMAFLLRPLLCSGHANVLLPTLRYLFHRLITFSSLLFVGTEYAISFHYTESDCVKWYIFQEVGTQLLVAAVESILIVRGMPTIFLTLIGPDYSFPSSTRALRSQSQCHRATCCSFPPRESHHACHLHSCCPRCKF